MSTETTTPDAPTVASSATPEPVPLPDLASLSKSQREQWRLTGKVEADPPKDVPAASSSAEPVTQAPSTEGSTPAASEPAKGKGVKARNSELDAEITELREKLKLRAALREELDSRKGPDVTPAASSPATQALIDTIQQPNLAQPMLSEQQFFAQFPDAPYTHYGIYTTKYLLAEDRAIQAHQSQAQQRQSYWQSKIAEIQTEAPDFSEQIATGFQSLPDTPANRALTTAIVDSGNARLAYHLATHPEQAQRLVRLSPELALVELGQIAASLSTPATPAGPVLKTQSSAPPPPPSLTTRASAPANEIDAALAAGDFRRYKALADARDVAMHR